MRFERRDFLKSSLAGLGAMLSGGGMTFAADDSAPTSSGTARLDGKFHHLEFDLGAGRFNLRPTKGPPLLLQATAAVGVGAETILVADARYSRSSQTRTSETPGVAGPTLVVSCKDSMGQLNLELSITLLNDRPGAVFELSATNVSEAPISIPHIEALRAVFSEEAGLGFGTFNFPIARILTNGYMYYDPGTLLDSMAYAHRDITSWWNIAVHMPKSKESLIVGHLDNRTTEGQIITGWDSFRGTPMTQATMNLTARGLTHQRFTLKPGATLKSGRVLLLKSNDPFASLEDYATTCGQVNQVKLNPIINGWCSWFYMQHNTTEAEQVRNAEFIAKHLKPYGMEWVQIDDGYQRAFGDWEANERFPKGMKWLAGHIRSLGLKAGLWLAPFLISRNTTVAKEHPDWLVHNTDGSPFVSRQEYVLDITVPKAREWYFNLFKRIAEDWGYDFIKIDFVERSILAAPRYADPTMTRAKVYRLGIETIRKAIGPDRHLLDCGPAMETLGIADSMRIELDLDAERWEQYVGNFNSTLAAMGNRYYFHKRTWINDADHLGLKLLNITQGQSAATMIGLSGGTTISGDPLPDLDPERLEILKKTLPAYGEAARPTHLFENPFPELFSLPIKKDSLRWHLAAWFNRDATATCQRELELAGLGLDAKKTYLAFEFWTQKFLGEVVGKLPLHFVPAQVNLVALREMTDVPQILGTDRHYTQGAIELENVAWNNTALTGQALGAPGMKWRMSVHVPSGWIFDATSKNDHWTTSLDNNILRVQFDFGDASKVDWTLQFRKQ